MTTHMRREVLEIPDALARLGAENVQRLYSAEAQRLADLDPQRIVTIARGSSACAAMVLKYALEASIGRAVAPVGPSVATVYDAALAGERTLALAISQSGASPDLTRLAQAYRKAGAHVTALTNTEQSPLSAAASGTLQVMAGHERAVAATKSLLCSVVGGLYLIGHWTGQDALIRVLRDIPEALDAQLFDVDTKLGQALAGHGRIFILGRGRTQGIAQEAALKAMELCGAMAIGISTAEVLHGPSVAFAPGTLVIVLRTGGETEAEREVARRARVQGATLVVLEDGGDQLWPTTDVRLLIRLYTALESAARALGRDPDAPQNLSKETLTT